MKRIFGTENLDAQAADGAAVIRCRSSSWRAKRPDRPGFQVGAGSAFD
jgi:hypothetical protein